MESRDSHPDSIPPAGTIAICRWCKAPVHWALGPLWHGWRGEDATWTCHWEMAEHPSVRGSWCIHKTSGTWFYNNVGHDGVDPLILLMEER